MIRSRLFPVRAAGPAAFLVLVASGCAGWRGARTPDLPPAPPTYLAIEDAAYGIGAPVGDGPTGAPTTVARSEEGTAAPWWSALGDTTLDRLMVEAFSGNLTLEQAAARVYQWKAAYVSARASLFPAVSGQLSVTETDDLGDPESPSPATFFAARFTTALNAVYEFDIWGRLTAARKAADQDQLAAQEDLQAAALSLSALVARSYYLVVELTAQQDLLERTVASFEDSHDLVLARYQRGVAPSVDVYQSRTSLAGARAQLALVRLARATAENALGVLLGRYPGTVIVPPHASLPVGVPPVPVGLPAELVQRRPDVRAAWHRLLAADRRAAEAVANRLPALTLTGSIGGRSDDLSGSIDPDNMIWSAVGTLTAPIFEGGRRKANADRAEAAYHERKAAWIQAVLTAWREVEDALVRGREQRFYALHLVEQVEAADASLRLAMDRYIQGVSDFLPVVVTQTAYLNAQRSRIAATRGLVDAHIDLAVAAGGDWTEEAAARRLSSFRAPIREGERPAHAAPPADAPPGATEERND